MADQATLRVLLVEDDPAMVTLVTKLLQTGGYQQITVAETGAAALATCGDADLVILDHQLPDTSGSDLLPRLVARPNPPSVIMVTGQGNESLAAAALRAGAEDYLAKDRHLAELLPQVVERVRRTRALREATTAVERELVRAERLAAIGEMTVTLHHEINNPLMVALSELEILLAGGTQLDPETRDSVGRARDAMLRIRDIVRKAGALRDAQSEQYWGGLRMITLAEDRGHDLPHKGKALLWIGDQELARVTAMLLRHAGFSPERVGTVPELAVEAARPGVTLVVVFIAAGESAKDALGGFHPPAARRWVLVALVPGDPGRARTAGADTAIAVPFDPATLGSEILAAVDARA